VAAEERVGHEVGVERGLELLGEIASGDAPQDLAVSFGEARVPGAAPAAPFLEKLFADGHGFHCASDPARVGPRSRWRIGVDVADPSGQLGPGVLVDVAGGVLDGDELVP
jgi:hypothetical protein